MIGRRGFGTVRRLPSGRYQAGYVGRDGARVYAPDTFVSERAADAWLVTIRAQRHAALGELAELAELLAQVSQRLAALAADPFARVAS
jgi:hypothetical protein